MSRFMMFWFAPLSSPVKEGAALGLAELLPASPSVDQRPRGTQA